MKKETFSPERAKQQIKKFFKAVGVFLALLFAVVILAAILGDDPAEEVSPGDEPREINFSPGLAKSFAEDFVKDNLKSPGTAEFVREFEHIKTDDTTIFISGAVDSQNSFGALVRSDYEIIIIHRKTLGKIEGYNLNIKTR